MFEHIRTQIGSAGLIVAVVALVAALGGGAYAASGGGGKATASAKGKAGPRGKTGKTGPAGPAGPAGATGSVGPLGPKGDPGAAGSDGSSGAPGTVGKSVVTASFEGTDEPAGEPCEEQGGNSIEVEGSGVKRYACNGAAGAKGSPWTAGGTLPVGSTETGGWAFFSSDPSEESVASAPISFSIPLAAALDSTHVVYVTSIENPDPTHCTGSVGEPKAASGYLCVYSLGTFESELLAINALDTVVFGSGEEPGTTAASKAGAIIRFTAFGKEAEEEGIPIRGDGSFAVTG